MSDLFEIRDVDRRFYEERLRDFLPDNMIDMHTHVWLDRFCIPDDSRAGRTVTWPSRVAVDNSVEDLLDTYRLMFPGKQVTPMMFTTLDVDLDAANAYVSESAAKHRLPALIFSTPEWPADEFERRMIDGRFLGAKSYLSLAPAYLPTAEIRILDFFPPHQLEVLDRHGWIMMLHVPRHGRLRDPVNLAQMIEIERRYPNIQLIIAHVGRAYCPEDVGDAFDVLAESERMHFDFAANTNASVFEQLIRAVGPKRILFGSDLPILRMRMRRICRDGIYVNLVPRGMYGDVSGDKNMGELDGDEAAKLTFFMYEEIDAFRLAAEACGLTRDDIESIFHGNAEALIAKASA